MRNWSKSDVAHFTSHAQPVSQQKNVLILLQKVERTSTLHIFFVVRQVVRGMYNAQHRFSTSFAAMLRDKLDIFVARITVA